MNIHLAILRFLAQQGRLDIRIKVKFGKTDRTDCAVYSKRKYVFTFAKSTEKRKHYAHLRIFRVSKIQIVR